MGFEAGMLAQEQEKKQKKSPEEEQKAFEKMVDFQKKKEKIRHSEETDRSLSELKNLIEMGSNSIDTNNVLQKAINAEVISIGDIEEIFDKIEEIEQIENIDKYLPKEFRVSIDEYKQALVSDIYRVQTLTKINTALNIIVSQIPDGTNGLKLIANYLNMLDKNLLVLQEHNIDMKDTLVKVDENQDKSKSKTFWQKFIDFIKKIFN